MTDLFSVVCQVARNDNYLVFLIGGKLFKSGVNYGARFGNTFLIHVATKIKVLSV